MQFTAHRYKLLHTEIRYGIEMDVRYASGGVFKGHVADVVKNGDTWTVMNWAEGFDAEEDEGDIQSLKVYVGYAMRGVDATSLTDVLARFRKGAEEQRASIDGLWRLEDIDAHVEKANDAWASMQQDESERYGSY